MKEIAFRGTSTEFQPKNVIGHPAAAKLSLRAPWLRTTLVTVVVAEKVKRSLEMVEAIALGRKPRDCGTAPGSAATMRTSIPCKG